MGCNRLGRTSSPAFGVSHHMTDEKGRVNNRKVRCLIRSPPCLRTQDQEFCILSLRSHSSPRPVRGHTLQWLRVRTTSAGSKSALYTHFQSRTDWQRVHALQAARPVRFALLRDSSTKHHVCPLSLEPHLRCRPGKCGSRSTQSDELASSAKVD